MKKSRSRRSISRSKIRKSTSRKKSLTSRRSKSKKSLTCSQELRRKVAINIKEGTYANTAQAVAVAYSQVRKSRPGCRKILKQK